MDNLNSVIEQGKLFLEVIPDSPFPAPSVVLGLAHLLQLGTVHMMFFVFIGSADSPEGNYEC